MIDKVMGIIGCLLGFYGILTINALVIAIGAFILAWINYKNKI